MKIFIAVIHNNMLIYILIQTQKNLIINIKYLNLNNYTIFFLKFIDLYYKSAFIFFGEMKPLVEPSDDKAIALFRRYKCL